MRAFAITVTLGLVLAACLGPSGQLFRTTLLHISPDNPAGDLPLPVVLGDETGLVVAIEPAIGDTSDLKPSVRSDPVDPNAFIVSWLGGMCDNDAQLLFRPHEAGYSLALIVGRKVGLGCPAAAVSRGVRVKTSRPIAPESIETFGSG
jgi:hypothetical protein